MKYLNVAEKNDAAKTIAGHLSRGTARRREGLSKYNKIYEFEAEVCGSRSLMVMTSVSGHLLGYEFVAGYKKWRGCDPISLFEAPVAKTCSAECEPVKRTLEREIRDCDGLVLWTDCDREGENIAFEILSVCAAVRPDLKVHRAKFSEITAASVRRALNSLGPPDARTADAVDVRQELDLRIGAAFTRFQTLRLQRRFPVRLADTLVSYGSCQFPTLGFVVERYRAVQDFTPESFWKIQVRHEAAGTDVTFHWRRHRLFDRTACAVLHDACLESPEATVASVVGKPKTKRRPLPLDTVEMEKLGSRKLRINAKEVMKIAERLYTRGIISYPRTETDIYPDELDLAALVAAQTASPEWGSFARRIADSGGPTPSRGKKSDRAHPPIHPIRYADDLGGNERRVFELVARSFLACCSEDAVGHETDVEIEVAGERFAAAGLAIVARNYLDVYPYERWNAKEIPDYREGERFTPASIDMERGQTSPPSLLTEADLIALMERHGIGTDATHADHIETVKSRSYVALADGVHFVPGLLGMALVDGYDSMGLALSKPDLRAGLEEDLRAVCEGRKTPRTVLSRQIRIYREVYLTVVREAEKIDLAVAERFRERPADDPGETTFGERVMRCDRCGSDMVLRRKRNDEGHFVSCVCYPECKNALWLPDAVESVRTTVEKCERCGPGFTKLEFRWRTRALEVLYPSPHVGCLGGCDQRLLHALNVKRNRDVPNARRSPGPRVDARSNPAGGPERAVRPTEENLIVCDCGEPAVSLTVRKNNSNAGRRFYKCPRPAESGGCKFFLWAPGEGTSDLPERDAARPFVAPDATPRCGCERPSKKLTVAKEGPNRGRQFYVCRGSPSDGCGFFQWADGESASEPRRPDASVGHAAAKRGRKRCGNCREEGHTRNRCPRTE